MNRKSALSVKRLLAVFLVSNFLLGCSVPNESLYKIEIGKQVYVGMETIPAVDKLSKLNFQCDNINRTLNADIKYKKPFYLECARGCSVFLKNCIQLVTLHLSSNANNIEKININQMWWWIWPISPSL